MKIMYVAVFTETSTNTPQANAFEKLGHNVIRYDFKEKLKEFISEELTDYYGTAPDMGAFESEWLDLSDVDQLPESYTVHQNYPNPFNPTTQIKYDLPEDAMVNITIYDLMGRSIKSLVNSNQSAGYRSIQWNATNNLGEPVSAGMYIYMIQAGQFRQVRKMVLLK